MKFQILIFQIVAITFLMSCGQKGNGQPNTSNKLEAAKVLQDFNKRVNKENVPIVGAAQFDRYQSVLENKKIGVIVNQTSKVGHRHLVDKLLEENINIKTIFAPEHGFRGKADAGEQIKNGVDAQTGIPVKSLYGNTKKPTKEMLDGLDVMVFDIQDVGARFYTYISTMHYVMEACAENNVEMVVLDRPNPNGHYVDGPVLQKTYTSFVGMHPIPVVHGLTVGELANMINEEGWLKNGIKCKLTVVPVKNYSHKTKWSLSVKPSPNLPNDWSIALYPSLCFFEGTVVSVGRGTNKQFQLYGHPSFKDQPFQFTPQPMDGAKYPKHEGKNCSGKYLTNESESGLQQLNQLELSYLINAFKWYKEANGSADGFFLKNNFINKLAGTSDLKNQILAELTEEEIRASWEPALSEYKELRKKYLLYPDFD